MTREIVAIEGRLTSVQVEEVIAAVSGEWTPRACRKLYYPYFSFELRYTARTLLGRSGVRASCLVDARTGLASTSDPFELERVEVDASDILEPRLTDDAALSIAERYVAYVVKNKRKALVVPDTDVLDRKLVRKPFWIVECTQRDPGAPGFSVLVDGITGGFHVVDIPQRAPLRSTSSTLRNSMG